MNFKTKTIMAATDLSKIKELFASLSKDEQIRLIKALSYNSLKSISIDDFVIKHQKRYGCNVEFTILQSDLDHASMITAIVCTAFGDFSGKGLSQKIAKANAVENANLNWR